MRRSLLILFFFLLASCNRHEHALPTEPTPAPSTTSTVVGRVLTLETHQPMANVAVGYTVASDVFTDTLTDASGRYALSGLAPGFHSVRVAGKYAGNIQLGAGGNERDLFVPNNASCKVQYGTVFDARTGNPIAGAKVTIFGREATTAADGTYAIDFGCSGFVQGSTISITASADGYLPYLAHSRASFLCTCSLDIPLEPR